MIQVAEPVVAHKAGARAPLPSASGAPCGSSPWCCRQPIDCTSDGKLRQAAGTTAHAAARARPHRHYRARAVERRAGRRCCDSTPLPPRASCRPARYRPGQQKQTWPCLDVLVGQQRKGKLSGKPRSGPLEDGETAARPAAFCQRSSAATGCHRSSGRPSPDVDLGPVLLFDRAQLLVDESVDPGKLP